MANFTAADIKALREQTGAGMLDVKKALDEADGDRAKAVEILRVKGLKGVTKREGRSASDGLVAAHVDGGVGTLVEINCETDFVAKNDRFGALAQQVLDQAVATGAADVESLLASKVGDETLADVVTNAAATLGEKVEVRRVARVEGAQVSVVPAQDQPGPAGADRRPGRHQHRVRDRPRRRDARRRDVADLPLARRGALPTPSTPSAGSPRRPPARRASPSRRCPRSSRAGSTSYFKDNVLLEQPFAKDPKKSVGKVLEEAGTAITQFARFRVGS